MKIKHDILKIKMMEHDYKKNDQVIIVGDPLDNNKGYYKGYLATVINHNKFHDTYIVSIDTSGDKFKIDKRCLQPLPKKQ
jgi:hypothetical protein